MSDYCYKVCRDYKNQIYKLADWTFEPVAQLMYPVKVQAKHTIFFGLKFKNEDIERLNFRIDSIWQLASNRHFYLYVEGKYTNYEFEDWYWKKRIPRHFKSFSVNQLDVPVMKYKMGGEEFFLYSLNISQHSSYMDYDYDYFAEAFCIILNYIDSEQGTGNQWRVASDFPIKITRITKEIYNNCILDW